MKIAIGADWHFGHDKLVEKAGRPEDFAQRIIKGIERACLSADVLLCLGDVCIGNDAYHHCVLWQATKWSNIKRWLILGNHDRKTKTWYLQSGWDFVADELYLNIHGLRILFTHRPQPPGDYDLNIHGHLHNTGHHPECGRHDKQVLIASEPTYQPVMLSTIIKGVTRP